MLYKEDVFNELRDKVGFEDYTLELCESDLNQLKAWGSLTYFQDPDNVSTLKEFINKKYRYQITDYGEEIERFVINLEMLSVKTSSLEPKLFEKLKMLISKLSSLNDASEIYDCFNELNYQFTSLNNNYKDFLKTFHDAKSDELMKKKFFDL